MEFARDFITHTWGQIFLKQGNKKTDLIHFFGLRLVFIAYDIKWISSTF